MKTNYTNKKFFFSVLSFLVLGAGLPAAAEDVTDAFSSVYTAMLGKQSAMIAPGAAADCDTMASGSGWIQRANIINCFMKYDLALKGVGSGTKQVGTGSSAMTIHAEITAGCTAGNVAGTTTPYDFQINGWVCTGASTACTSPSQFSRLMSMCFNWTDDGTGLNGKVNQGEIIMDTSIMDGLTPGAEAFWMVYDLGSTAAAQKAAVKQVQPGVFAVRGDIARTDKSHLSFAMALNSVAGHPVPSLRFTGTIDRTNNTGTGYAEGGGFGSGPGLTTTVNATASGDTAGGGACVSRTATATDWAYTVTSSGGACVPTMPNALDSVTTVGSYTISGLVGTWHGMAAAPSAL